MDHLRQSRVPTVRHLSTAQRLYPATLPRSDPKLPGQHAHLHWRPAACRSSYTSLPFEAPADATYGATRATLEAAGTPIGANDLLIAAQTLALDMVLVTNNERAFQRVQGLTIENWLR